MHLDRNPPCLAASGLSLATLTVHSGSACAYACILNVSYGTPKHRWDAGKPLLCENNSEGFKKKKGPSRLPQPRLCARPLVPALGLCVYYKPPY